VGIHYFRRNYLPAAPEQGLDRQTAQPLIKFRRGKTTA
jgi:hypothetical protein